MIATAISLANKYANMDDSLSLRGAITVGANHYSSAALCAWADRLIAVLDPVLDRDSRVALAVSDIGAFAASVVAIRSLNAVPVLLSSSSPGTVRRDAERLSARLRDCGADVALVDDNHWRALAPAIQQLSVSDCRVAEGLDEPELTHRQRSPDHRPNPADAALIVYTSGSRSGGLGVVLSRANLDYLLRMNLHVNRWSPSDCLLSALPLSHLAGFLNLMGACTYGARALASPSFMWMTEVINTCIAQRVTVIGSVPYYMGLLARQRRLSELDSLRLLVCSAAPIRHRDVARMSAALPDLQIINAYGLTEAFRALIRWPDSPAEQIAALGMPMPEVELELRDQAGQIQSAPAATGIAWVRGPNVMAGYWNRPELTAARVRDGWLCTGDTLSRTADGCYWLEGRREDILSGGGQKCHTQSVERRIADACPVVDVCVIGRSRPAAADGNDGRTTRDSPDIDEVVAVVVVEPGAQVTLTDVRRACADHLHSAFWPTRLCLVAALPRTRSGKVDRRKVHDLLPTDGL